MIAIDINELTGAEVDLIEDTLNDKLAARLGDRIVTFSDVLAEIMALAPDGPEPKGVRIPMGKLMRTIELVVLRRTNPAATWDETGQNPLKPELAPPTAPAVVVVAPTNGDEVARSWQTPAPVEPSAQLA